MALLFALALTVPLLRSFYELSTPTGEAAAAWAIGTVLGVGACWALYVSSGFESNSLPSQ
jgi:hypothetical protein